MHVTFLFAFSSRYAKTRSNFRKVKVVRQHTEGTMFPSYLERFVGNLLFFPAVKEL